MNPFKLFSKLLDEKRQLIINNGANEGQVVFMAGSGGCFAHDTEVVTKDGNKVISDITTEDLVLSLDNQYQPVINTFTNDIGDTKLTEVYFDDGSSVICTEDHKFLIDGEWVPAKDLV